MCQARGASSLFFATDRNRDAAATTATTLTNHGFVAEAREVPVPCAELHHRHQPLTAAHVPQVTLTDLLGAVEQRLSGSIDLLLFNPPYVPSPPEEASWRPPATCIPLGTCVCAISETPPRGAAAGRSRPPCGVGWRVQRPGGHRPLPAQGVIVVPASLPLPVVLAD